MKKLFSVILLVGMSVSIFGCSPNTSSDVAMEDLSSEIETVMEEDVLARDEQTENIYEEVYHDKLDYIYGCVMGSALDYSSLSGGEAGIIYASWGKDKEEALNSIGYTIQDINGDSFLELVIGSMDQSQPGTEIYTIYQINEDRTRTLCWLKAEPRTKLMYMQDGRIYFNKTDSSYGEYSFGVLEVYDTDTYLDCTEYYFPVYDPLFNADKYYRNSFGWFNVDDSEKLDFTEEDFFNKDNEFIQQCAHLKLTPLSEYTPSDSKFTQTAELDNSENSAPLLNVMLAEGVRENYPNRTEHPTDWEEAIDVLCESTAPLKEIALLDLYATGMNENGEIMWSIEKKIYTSSKSIIEAGNVSVYGLAPSDSYPLYGFSCIDADGNSFYYAIVLTENSVSLQEINEENIEGEVYIFQSW